MTLDARLRPVPATGPIDWRSYASVYDVMAELNPAYRQLLDDYTAFVARLDLAPGDVLVDLGAGTGNYSLAAAGARPGCRVVHVDASAAMNDLARAKAVSRGLANVEIRTCSVDGFDPPEGSVALVTAVHSLYTFPDPPAVALRIGRWLRPGGVVWAVDPSGRMEVGEWRRYIFRHSCRERGLGRTLAMLWRARAVAAHNRRIDAALTRGELWGKDAAALCSAFEAAGLVVSELSATYRGCSHRLVAHKPTMRPGAMPAVGRAAGARRAGGR